MARRIQSFAERRAAADRADAISVVSTTERLLAAILVELLSVRAERGLGELSQRLQAVGFSRLQAAALLNTTAATLAVSERRESAEAQVTKEPSTGAGSRG